MHTSYNHAFNTNTNRLRTLVENLMIIIYSCVLQVSVPYNSTDCMQSMELSPNKNFL